MPGSTHFNGVSVGQLISEGARNPSPDALPKPLWREFPGVLHEIQIPGPSLDWLTQSLWGGAEGSARAQGCCGRGEVGGVGWEGCGGRGEVGEARGPAFGPAPCPSLPASCPSAFKRVSSYSERGSGEGLP